MKFLKDIKVMELRYQGVMEWAHVGQPFLKIDKRSYQW